MRSFSELLSGVGNFFSRAGSKFFEVLCAIDDIDGRSISEMRKKAEFMRTVPYSAVGGIRYIDEEEDLEIKKLSVKWLGKIITKTSAVEYMSLVKDETFFISDMLRNELYIMLREKLSGIKVSECDSVDELRVSDDMDYLSPEEHTIYLNRLRVKEEFADRLPANPRDIMRYISQQDDIVLRVLSIWWLKELIGSDSMLEYRLLLEDEYFPIGGYVRTELSRMLEIKSQEATEDIQPLEVSSEDGSILVTVFAEGGDGVSDIAFPDYTTVPVARGEYQLLDN